MRAPGQKTAKQKAQQSPGDGRQRGRMSKGTGTLGSDRYVHLDCGDIFMDMYVCQDSSNCKFYSH